MRCFSLCTREKINRCLSARGGVRNKKRKQGNKDYCSFQKKGVEPRPSRSVDHPLEGL